jgi:hypothetical protein
MTNLVFNTQVNINAFLNPAAAQINSAQGMAMQMASGIVGLFSGRLATGPFAFPSLPTTLLLRGGVMLQPQTPQALPSFVPTPGAQWTASLKGEHQGTIDLGDGYTLQLDERNSEITIHNAETGETTRIWGDPHVDVNGKRVFDFWGTTTFTLENGTKITIDTEQYARNPNEYVSSKLTITKGDQAIVVDGISENQLGDLEISMSNDGELLDAVTRDGFVLHENATGSSWRSELTGEIATQTDLNATRVGGLYGPGSTMPSLGEISESLSTFLFFGIVASMSEAMGGDYSPAARAYRPVEFF